MDARRILPPRSSESRAERTPCPCNKPGLVASVPSPHHRSHQPASTLSSPQGLGHSIYQPTPGPPLSAGKCAHVTLSYLPLFRLWLKVFLLLGVNSLQEKGSQTAVKLPAQRLEALRSSLMCRGPFPEHTDVLTSFCHCVAPATSSKRGQPGLAKSLLNLSLLHCTAATLRRCPPPSCNCSALHCIARCIGCCQTIFCFAASTRRPSSVSCEYQTSCATLSARTPTVLISCFLSKQFFA